MNAIDRKGTILYIAYICIDTSNYIDIRVK